MSSAAEFLRLGDQGWDADPQQLGAFECSYDRGYVQQLVYVCITCLHRKQLVMAEPTLDLVRNRNRVASREVWARDPAYSEEARATIDCILAK